MTLSKDDLLWHKQNVPNTPIADFEKILDVIGNGNGKTDSNSKSKSNVKLIQESIYKYSDKGIGVLREAAIVDGLPCFISLHNNIAEKEFSIERNIKKLLPPSMEEYPYSPYEFRDISEVNEYIQRAMDETPDTLMDKIKIQIKRFNDIESDTVILLSVNILGSYFQDRFSTCHYIFVVGDNGTGKSAFGDSFECLAYRAVNITNVTEAFWFRIFGTNEAGQVTIIAEEVDKMEENSHIMSMLKQGYQPNSKVSRMNYDQTKLEFYCPFGIKIMIGEKSPGEWKGRGMLDRTFQVKSYKGVPDFNIKEIRNPQGNPKRLRLYEEINDLRKLLFAYRLLHIKDPFKEIKIGLIGRDEELCKPYLQLFYTLGASKNLQEELESTFQRFINIKNERKDTSIEAHLLPAIINLIDQTGEDIIPTTEIWHLVQNTIEGVPDEKQPNTIYHTDDFGQQYRNTIIKLICDKFGANLKHTKEGNVLIFSKNHLLKMQKIYGDPNGIQTKLLDDEDKGDSVTHVTRPAGES